MVNIQIRVKFRIKGWTIGTVEKTVQWEPQFGVPIPTFDTVLVNDRGIFVRVYA